MGYLMEQVSFTSKMDHIFKATLLKGKLRVMTAYLYILMDHSNVGVLKMASFKAMEYL